MVDIRTTHIDDLPELASFMSAHGMTCSPRYLRWKYWGRSNARSSDVSLVAVVDDDIVGHIGVLPTYYGQGEQQSISSSGWFCDWVTRQDYRSRGLGVMLMRELQDRYPVLMTIQGTGDTREVLPQLGWHSNERLAIYKLNVTTDAMNLDTPVVTRAMAELARTFYYHPVRCDCPKGWHIIDGQNRGDLWTHLEFVFARLRLGQEDCCYHFRRDDDFLRRWFREHPSQAYELSIVCDDAGGIGYVVWRIDIHPNGQRCGRIVDMALPWNHGRAWRWLIGEVVARMISLGAVQVECLSGIDSILADALKKNRFLPRQILPLWTSPQAGQVTQHTAWHVTYADSDIDIAHEGVISESAIS